MALLGRPLTLPEAAVAEAPRRPRARPSRLNQAGDRSPGAAGRGRVFQDDALAAPPHSRLLPTRVRRTGTELACWTCPRVVAIAEALLAGRARAGYRGAVVVDSPGRRGAPVTRDGVMASPRQDPIMRARLRF